MLDVKLYAKGSIVMNSELYCAVCNEQHEGDQQVICTCGWKDRIVEREMAQQRDRRASVRMVISAVGVLVLALHFIKWGEYSFSIPFLRLRQATGLLSAGGYTDLATACTSIRQWSCVENAYEQVFLKTKDPEAIRMIASMQLRLEKNDQATESYGRYFKAGGKDLMAHLEYAALLESKHRVDEAMVIYRKAVELTPASKLPVQATAGLVRLEIKMERYTKALNRILEFHALAPNAKGYLNTELEQLRALVKNQRRVARR